MGLSKSFTSRDAAIAYAQSIEENHQVDVRQTAKGHYRVFVDSDCCHVYGYRAYSNL